MIEQNITPAAPDGYEFRLRPNHSVSARGLVAFFSSLAATSLLVAAYSAMQGNLFAPGFALLELSVVAVCLRLVWRGLQRQQNIAVGPDAVVVGWQSGSPGSEVRFDPYWVNVRSVPGRSATERARLLLASHGKAVEIGAFLAEDERSALERQLRQALQRLRGRRADERIDS